MEHGRLHIHGSGVTTRRGMRRNNNKEEKPIRELGLGFKGTQGRMDLVDLYSMRVGCLGFAQESRVWAPWYDD